MAATLEQRRKQRFQFLRSLYEMSRGSERVLFYVHEVGDAVGLGQMEAETAAHYLGEKGLIRVVMGHIISVSQLGVDELEAALEHPQQSTVHFPPVDGIAWRPVTAQPAIPQSATGKQPAEEAPAAPVQEEPIKPLPAHIVQNDSNELAALELQRICEAIGLDPKEFAAELSPHPEFPGTQQAKIEPAMSGYEEHEPQSDSRRRFSFNEADLDVILESVRLQLPKLGFAPDELAEAQAEIDTARAQLASPKPKPSILAASLRTLLSILENAGPALATDTRENLIAIRDFQQRLSA